MSAQRAGRKGSRKATTSRQAPRSRAARPRRATGGGDATTDATTAGRTSPLLRLGTGGVADPPDARDLTASHVRLGAWTERLGVRRLAARHLPPRVDLARWAGPVYFQGGFNTCNAHVVAGLVTYFQNRTCGKSVPPSRLFLYKVAKNFLQQEGNAGVYIRQVMGVLKLVGVPPERYWPYPDPGTLTAPRSADPLLDAEPSAFCYAIADDYKAITYYRLDEEGQAPAALLHVARAHLAAQVPFSLGFPLFRSVAQSRATGKIPYPQDDDEPSVGNHAVLVVGFDDAVEVSGDGSRTTRGAFRIQNSWGEEWGEKGFGWLPYEFVLQGRTRDFWTLTRAEWTDTGLFQLDDAPAPAAPATPSTPAAPAG